MVPFCRQVSAVSATEVDGAQLQDIKNLLNLSLGWRNAQDDAIDKGISDYEVRPVIFTGLGRRKHASALINRQSLSEA